ncbi:MAG: MFS transporter [Chloroflexales bacterium]|nr:MFS transporter [Chloroflexales bacterium]
MTSTTTSAPAASEQTVEAATLWRKWPTLRWLALAELLAMGAWFSASAVIPALTSVWSLDDTARAWMTMSVQIGFVVGAFGSALLNLADRIPAARLFTASALLAALSTALIPLVATGPALALPLRFLTGVALAGVYPVGMKIMASWTRADRGLGIGLLVAALTVGSGTPHLLTLANGIADWRLVLLLAAALAALGALIAARFVSEGPYRAPAPRFDWRAIGMVARDRPLVLANLGYLGHQWEIYAMWTWVPLFLRASYEAAGVAPGWASLAAFAAISVGGLGSLLGGLLADRLGRTSVAITALVISGSCALVIGPLFGASPLLVTAVALLWGFAVVADSAQFSAAISELCDSHYTGTALTLQTSLGFLLTLGTIWLVPVLVSWSGWTLAFATLALGPVVGVAAMLALRRSPAAARLAGGRG